MSLTELGRDDSQGFEICLRQRITDDGDTIDELVVNGAFAMDSVDHSSEDALAALVPRSASRVLVAGLGLGFTTLEVLTYRARAVVDVVELSTALVDWARRGATETLSRVAGDPRVRFWTGDVATVLSGGVPEPVAHDDPWQSGWDAILLDVDNGPDFLIHQHNASLYRAEQLATAARQLNLGGVLAVWCQQHAPELAAAMAELALSLDGSSGTQLVPVSRDGHQLDYAIHWLSQARWMMGQVRYATNMSVE